MSLANAIIIKNRKITFARMHYNAIIHMLENGLYQGEFLDGGYLLIDFDKGILLDSQNCFSLSDIRFGEIRKRLAGMRIIGI